jgi:hypothetical protein
MKAAIEASVDSHPSFSTLSTFVTMPSLTTDTSGWLSNGAVQAPSPTHANGITTNGVNRAHASNETNGINGKNHQSPHTAFDDVPVLIVGGGPTGLLLAYLLSKLNGLSISHVLPRISI